MCTLSHYMLSQRVVSINNQNVLHYNNCKKNYVTIPSLPQSYWTSSCFSLVWLVPVHPEHEPGPTHDRFHYCRDCPACHGHLSLDLSFLCPKRLMGHFHDEMQLKPCCCFFQCCICFVTYVTHPCFIPCILLKIYILNISIMLKKNISTIEKFVPNLQGKLLAC